MLYTTTTGTIVPAPALCFCDTTITTITITTTPHHHHPPTNTTTTLITVDVEGTLERLGLVHRARWRGRGLYFSSTRLQTTLLRLTSVYYDVMI